VKFTNGNANNPGEFVFTPVLEIPILELAKNGPIISIDCKKKERLGPLWREGKYLSTGPIRVKDHDYKHLAKGKVIPH